MSKVKTKAYGEIDVPENSEIYFMQEIFGFENYRDYYLIEMKDLDNFYWLQSKDEADLAFIVVNPRLFKPEYVLDVDESDIKMIDLENEDDLVDLVIVNVPENPAEMTINLLGPILINAKNRKAIQVISNRNDYGTKYRVFSRENQLQEEMANNV